MSPMPSIVPRHLKDIQSCLLEEGRAGHKMAETPGEQRLDEGRSEWCEEAGTSGADARTRYRK